MSAVSRVGGILAAAGAIAVGAAIGAAAETALVRRTVRPAPILGFGSLRGQPVTVVADDGTPLHAEVDAAPPGADDLTVVMCHGYGLNLGSWHYQRAMLRQHARLVLWDQRSHGRSGRGPVPSIDRLGADLASVIDVLVPEGPILLLGHSMGGMSVMALAAAHPELFGSRIRGVGLVATAARGVGEASLGLPSPVAKALHRVAPGALGVLARSPELVEAGRRSGSDLGLLLTRAYSFGSDVHPDTTRFVSDMITGTPIDVVADFLPALQGHDKTAALSALSHTEVLVLVGTADLLTPVARSEEIVRLVPHAEYVLVENAGHMVILEKHEQVNAHLLGLLERVRTAHD